MAPSSAVASTRHSQRTQPVLEALEPRQLFSGGTLDPSFGVGGVVTTDMALLGSMARAVTVQADGKILAAGQTSPGGFALARYNPDGSLDTTFGTGGKVTSNDPGGRFDAVTVLSDGQILVAGTQNFSQMVVTRYNSDGTLDTTFGTNGSATPAFHVEFARLRAIAVQSNGDILVAGRARGGAISNDNNVFALAKLSPTGTFDPAFGGSRFGLVTTPMGNGPGGINSIAITPGGQIVAAGFATFNGDRSTALARYNANGTPDPTFGHNGHIAFNLGGSDQANSVAITPGEKIVTAGTAQGAFAVVQYTVTGQPDAQFGNQGLVLARFGDQGDVARSVLVNGNGRIVAAGTTGDGQIGLAAFRPDGTPATGFGTNGFTKVSAFPPDQVFAAAMGPTGNIVVAGDAKPGLLSQFALAQFLSGGSQLVAR